MSTDTPVRPTHPAAATTTPAPCPSGLDELAARVRGRLVRPGDDGWDTARAPWQRVVDQHPLAVLEVADAADVATAVGWAAEHGVPVTAQPVGHGATDALHGVLVLRTRALRDITVDVAAGTARVGAGVKVGELLAALQGSGHTFLAGSSPDPTVVGYVLGGGMSWFGRSWGLAANDVIALDVVDAHGTPARVTRASDPDLFWALRGGGGDFALVTGVEIALHRAPELYGGRLLWPVERTREVLHAFRTVTATAPPELTVWLHVYRFPPLPDLPEPIRGRAFVSVAVAHLGTPAEAERLLAPLRAVDGVVMDLMGTVCHAALGSIADEPVDPMPSLEHSLLLDELPDAALDALVEQVGPDADSPLLLLQVRHLGGALATALPSHGAAGHVREPYLVFALGVPVAPEVATALQASFDALDEALAPYGSGRTVPNFLGAHGDPLRARPAGVLDRLRAIKVERDPQGTVRSNRPVLG